MDHHELKQCVAENSCAAISTTVLEWLGYDSEKYCEYTLHFQMRRDVWLKTVP